MYYNKRATKLLMVAQVYKIKPIPPKHSTRDKLKRFFCSCCTKKRVEPNNSKIELESSIHPVNEKGAQPTTSKTTDNEKSSESNAFAEDLCAAPKEVIDEAYQLIEQNLDLMTLAKEINLLKVLTHTLLTDYQMVLAPLVSLNVDLAKHKHQMEIQKRLAKDPNDKDALLSLFGNIFKMQLEKKSLAMAYKELVSSAKVHDEVVDAPVDTNRDIRFVLWKQIDQDCVSALDNGGFFPFTKLKSDLNSGQHTELKPLEENIFTRIIKQTVNIGKDASPIENPSEAEAINSAKLGSSHPLIHTKPSKIKQSILNYPEVPRKPSISIHPDSNKHYPRLSIPLSIFSLPLNEPSQPKSIPINPPSVRKQNPQYDNLY